ncbi:uncharacterized protein [Acropora muricata]|uniref:uncharacterized protein isoform X3 n=1 Tax=Acropora muricata TaxID=159855 RepID=UPI0034E40000
MAAAHRIKKWLALFALIHGMMLIADGGSITWFDPPPTAIVTHSANIPKVNTTLTKGFPDEELSCSFSLSADLTLITVSMKFDGSSIANFVQLHHALSVQSGSESRFNVTWVPNKMTLLWFNVTSADEGEYRCEVLSFGGSAVETWARTIQVSLLVPPIINEVTGLTVTEEGNVTLKCSAEGKPTPTITWTRLSDNRIVAMPLLRISRHDSKAFRCTADNGVGVPATREVSIHVQYKPDSVSLVANTTENTNCSDMMWVNLTCQASDAHPPVENYQLLKNGEILVTSNNGTWIRKVLEAGKHVYSCRALHILGNVTSPDNVTITFKVPAQISVLASGSEILMEGGAVSFYCYASAYPEPIVSWSKVNADDFMVIGSNWLNFTNIGRDEAGDYICIANNTCGERKSSRISIDVQFAPENASLSTNLSTAPVVCAGMVVSFICSVEASNPAVDSFTLYENGSVISNKIDSGIWIKTLDTGGEVTYECHANNSAGTSRSDNISFTVEVSASVTVASNSIVTKEGQNATLVCNGFGLPEPSISWKNEANVVMGNGRIWSLYNINRYIAGQYTCTASNSCGNNSQKVDVVVHYKPDSVSLVANTTENTNCSDLMWVNLTCQASDANPPVKSYQLLKNGEILVTCNNGTWIRKVSEAGRHVYSCRALHILGNVTSPDNVTITIKVPAQISVLASGSEILREGDAVSFYCDASAYPEPIVSWSKVNADDFMVIGSNWLNFTNIGRDEAGDYICIANNTCGETKSSRRSIDVQFAPENASLSTNLSTVPVVCAGMVVSFICSVEASNPAVDTFTLYENGSVISNKTDSGVWIMTLDTAGEVTYKCHANNSAGTSRSDNISFTIEVSASVTVARNSIVAKEGQNVTLVCNGFGLPAPSISWMNESNVVMENGRIWSLYNINKYMAGQYTCTASNSCGNDSQKVDVVVQYKPDSVSLEANTTENTNCSDMMWVNLTCQASDANPPVKSYQLLKNGEILVTSNNGTWIRKVSEAGRHVYSCRALHILGNITSSDDVAVTFNVPAQISVLASGSEVLMEGGAVSFYCYASAYPEPIVSWSKVNADDFMVIGSNWLNFTNIGRDEAGDYICIANNTCGERKSSRISIDVQFAPENASLSTNLSMVPVVCAGMVVSFTCSVEASNPAVDTFTLYENGSVISNKTDSGVWIMTLDTAGEVTYKCHANNSAGTSRSDNISFTVKVSASVTVARNSIVAKEGENVTLVCNGFGLPAPSISWMNESNVVMENGRIWSLYNINKYMAGQYTCTASNSCGNNSQKVDVVVLYKPDSASLVANTTENTNCSDMMWVNLTCQASDANPPVKSYQLLKNGEILVTSNNGTWIRKVSEAGKHVYSCRALHILGNITSSDDVVVTFNVPAQVSVLGSGSEVLMEGGSVSFYCDASAYPEPIVSWSKVNADDFMVIESSWLNFTNIGRDKAGDYICIANNTCGKRKSSRRSVDVQYKPELVSLNIPTNKVCAGTAVTFTCSAGAANPPIQNYTLYKFVDGLTNISSNEVGVFNQRLYAKGQYNYTCKASNSVGHTSSVTKTVEVQITGSVKIANSKVVALEGTTFKVHCNISGFHSQHVSWINASNYMVETGSILKFPNISRHHQGEYNCSASNVCGDDSTRVYIDVRYPVEATGSGENATLPINGGVKRFSCPFAGNPAPNIKWYKGSEVNGAPISNEKELEARESGCYTCVANNSLGTPLKITQCLVDGQEIRANLTIVTYYKEAFKDLNSAASREFVAKFVEEMDKVYTNMPEYIGTKVTQLSPGSVIVHFTLSFKTAVTLENGLENLRVAISTGTFGDFEAFWVPVSNKSTTSTTPTESASNFPTLIVLTIIGPFVIVIILLVAVIMRQQNRLRSLKERRPYGVQEEGDAPSYENVIELEDVTTTNLPSENSTQQQIHNEHIHVPLQATSPSTEEPVSPGTPTPNDDYTPVDMRTLCWEVARDDVKAEKIIGKGAFGQVAKGMARNLLFRSEATSVAIKMVKANAPESYNEDLKAELELLKTLKPHPHVIRLLGCVTESEPLWVLIEYVPYGNLLGYLRKSRGLNDTYYDDPDIKPKTSLTSEQLMKFAWQIADGMSYLSLRKVIHRDLAARNVLVGERETCKITDFGMARDVQKEDIYERKTEGCLPVKWTAYESLLYGQYTTKSDVWSYGVVLYEISTIGGSPYPRIKGEEIANLLQQGRRMPKPKHVDDVLYQIMMNCWQSEPEARPSFKDLTRQLKRMENQHKSLIDIHIYDNALYANLEDLNA